MYASGLNGKGRRRRSYHEQVLPNRSNGQIGADSGLDDHPNDSHIRRARSESVSGRLSAEAILEYADTVLNRENYTADKVKWEEEDEKPRFPTQRRKSYCTTCVTKTTSKENKSQQRASCSTATVEALHKSVFNKASQDTPKEEPAGEALGDEKAPTAVSFTWDSILAQQTIGTKKRKPSISEIFKKPPKQKITDSMAVKILKLGKPADKMRLYHLTEKEVDSAFQDQFQKLSK